MTTETDHYYAEGYESGSMDLHKWMRRAEKAEARMAALEAALRKAYDQTCECCPDCSGCGNAHDILGRIIEPAAEKQGDAGPLICGYFIVGRAGDPCQKCGNGPCPLINQAQSETGVKA